MKKLIVSMLALVMLFTPVAASAETSGWDMSVPTELTEEIRTLFDRKKPATGRSAHEDFDSDGLRSLYERFCEESGGILEKITRGIAEGVVREIRWKESLEDDFYLDYETARERLFIRGTGIRRSRSPPAAAPCPGSGPQTFPAP